MSDRILVASRKGLLDIRRGTAGWVIAETAFLGSPVSMVLKDSRDGAVYAALDLGHFGVKLHRSGDDGKSWTEIATPSYAGFPESEAPAPSLKLIWALEAAGADHPGELWAGTIPGGLFRSEDKGASWHLVESLWDDPLRKQWFGGGAEQPGIHSICIDPRASRRIAIAVSCGGVWQSEDSGRSWKIGGKGIYAEYMPPEQKDNPAIQDVHRMVQCRAHPEALWAQHHNGAFRATAGIEEWTEVKPEPSKFGFAVAVHPNKPDTAWFVPAVKDEKRYPVDGKFVVCRTDDGGRTFRTLTEGLPQGPAYDLVYRHGLDIDAIGDRLAMASTTGNLWITENGGEQWVHVSAHLPPVYAVRFV